MKIVKVAKDNYGDITKVQVDTGETFSIEEAITLANENKIEGVNVGQTKDGKSTLRSNPDGDPTNNLANLPLIE